MADVRRWTIPDGTEVRGDLAGNWVEYKHYAALADKLAVAETQLSEARLGYEEWERGVSVPEMSAGREKVRAALYRRTAPDA